MQCETRHLLVQRQRLHPRIGYTYGKSEVLLSHAVLYKSPAQKLFPKCNQKDLRVWELSSRRTGKTQSQRHWVKLQPLRCFVGSGKPNARTDLNRSSREWCPSVDMGHVSLRKWPFFLKKKYGCFPNYTVMVVWFYVQSDSLLIIYKLQRYIILYIYIYHTWLQVSSTLMNPEQISAIMEW